MAFADHPEWGNCYCMHFHDEQAMGNDASTNRDRAVAAIQSGRLQGYLAYDGEDVAGWCNAGDKGSFPNLDLPTELREDNDRGGHVLSVVCLTVAPALRGRGVAAALLAQVCADSAARGCDWVEGYPQLDTTGPYDNHHGPLGLYEKLGFAVHRSLAHQAVVRKVLR